MHAPKKTFEFSKKILLVAGAINIVVILFAIIMMAITKDLTPLAYLIPSVAAEVATGTGFYYSKAKVENAIKLKKFYGVDNNQVADAVQDYVTMEGMSSM